MRTVFVASVLVVSAGSADAQPADPVGNETAATADASGEATAVVEVAAEGQVSVDTSGPAELEDGVDLAPPSTFRAARPAPVRPRRVDPLATTERWGGGVRLTALSGIGALPGVNFGGEVAINVRRDEVFAELAIGRWTPENDYYVLDGNTTRPLRLDVWTLRAGWSSMKMPIRGWLLAEIGELASLPGMQAMPGVVTRMVMGETPTARRWEAFGAGLGVAWPMSDQARLVGNMEIAIPNSQDDLAVNGYGEYQPDPMAARFSAGLEVGWR
jgi:hypothetical protein